MHYNTVKRIMQGEIFAGCAGFAVDYEGGLPLCCACLQIELADGGFVLIFLYVFAARVGVLCYAKLAAGTKSSLFGAGAEFGIGTRLLFGSLLERLRGGRLLFPVRRKK
jgi:hypothetical protein